MMNKDIRRKPPLLFTSQGDRLHEEHSIYSLLENQYLLTEFIPMLCNKRIIGSGFGWLVLAQLYTDDCCLWNPLSMQIIELPRLKSSHFYNRCVLSKPPTEPDCHILFNFLNTFCKIGDNKFIKAAVGEKPRSVIKAMIWFQGTIYAIIYPGYQFVTIHFVGKTLELRPMLLDNGKPWKVPQLIGNCEAWYLIESSCGGELFLVIKTCPLDYLDNSCVEFRVFGVDINGMECVELDHIDGLTIFISHCGNGVCCSTLGLTGIKSNAVYYTDSKGMNLFIYELDDRSTTSLLACRVTWPYLSINFWVDFLQDFLDA